MNGINIFSRLAGFRARMLLLLVCFSCYGNTLFNEYSFDDDIAVTENPFVQQGLIGIPDLLTQPYLDRGDMKAGFMPVSGILLAIEYELFGSNPYVSHFVNVVLFSILVLLIFWVFSNVFHLDQIHPALPFLIAAFYAVHPAFTEAVASIKNRSEILSLLFALLSLIFSLRFFSGRGRFAEAALALVFIGFSFLSKMTTIPVVGVIIIAGLYFEYYKDKKRFFILSGLLLLTTFSFAAFAVSKMEREIMYLENPLVDIRDISLIAGTILETLFFYFKFMLFPYPHRFYYGYNTLPVISILHPLAIASLILHLLLAVGGLLLFRKKQLLGFFIMAYILNISVFSNIFHYTGIVSERVLFVPGLWFVALLILFVFRVGRFDGIKTPGVFQKTILVAALVIFLFYCIQTIHRNSQWKDTFTLMSSDIGHLDNSVIANYLYANKLSFESNKSAVNYSKYFSLAKNHYRRAAQIEPNYYEPNFKLGMIYEYDEHKRDSAFYFFSRAYAIKPESTTAQFQIAKQYYIINNDREAEKLFGNLYGKLPNDAETLFFYAQVLYNSGQKERARKINDELLRLAPGTYYPYYNYGMVFWFEGDSAKAAGYFEKAVQAGYRENEVYSLLMKFYEANGMNDRVTALKKYFEN